MPAQWFANQLGQPVSPCAHNTRQAFAPALVERSLFSERGLFTRDADDGTRTYHIHLVQAAPSGTTVHQSTRRIRRIEGLFNCVLFA